MQVQSHHLSFEICQTIPWSNGIIFNFISILLLIILLPCSKTQYLLNSQLPSNFAPNYSLNHLPRLSLSSRPQSLTPVYCSSSLALPSSIIYLIPEVLSLVGERDSKDVLDAFLLGKALGEALTERIESAVGEFLSTVGRLQAEQQKQVQDFQEDVLKRAKRAKEKAARETLEEQGRLIPNSSMRNAGGSSNGNSPNPMNPASPTGVVNPDSTVDKNRINSDPLSSINIDE